MEGVYLAALLPEIRALVEGKRCLNVISPSPRRLGLSFRNGSLVLDWTPGEALITWEIDVPDSIIKLPVWEEHVEGSLVKEVSQVGVDRILVIKLEKKTPYSEKLELKLIFEAVGRNTNVILVRLEDQKILACSRRVTSSMSRIRTILPGEKYTFPPSSGMVIKEWNGTQAMSELDDTRSICKIFSTLEGVGPVTARAIVHQAEKESIPIYKIVGRIADSIQKGLFHPWMGPDGPLPLEIGPGRSLDNAFEGLQENAGKKNSFAAAKNSYLKSLQNELTSLNRKLTRMKNAMSELIQGSTYRKWAELLVASGDTRTKGKSSILLRDWDEKVTEIPLKPARTVMENAQRYFRKARNADRESRELDSRIKISTLKLTALVALMENVEKLENFESLPGKPFPKTGKKKQDSQNFESAVLDHGWRCLAGKNARQNETITFSIAKRGDIWFHARGTGGSHVLLKRDGKTGNPPRKVLIKAASIAARRSRSTGNRFVPVDYTNVCYVRRKKGGKRGEVIYTREKTIFVDLETE